MKYTTHQPMRDEWTVVDFQGRVVARCDAQHNAELICNLLNRYT